MDELPHVDEHAAVVEADRERVWAALGRVAAGSFSGGWAARLAGVLGCAERDADGSFPEVGSTLPGFRVARSLAPAELALEGDHRFARYALVFRIDELGDGRSRLRAETRATFPGARGRAYRALVIGTRGHVLVVRRLLGAVKRRAERTERRP